MGAWELATVALVLLGFSAISGRLERSLVTPAIFFTCAGLLAGPVLGLVDLSIGSESVKLLAEATLTLVLFADASRISLPALRKEFAVPARLAGDEGHRAGVGQDRRFPTVRAAGEDCFAHDVAT